MRSVARLLAGLVLLVSTAIGALALTASERGAAPSPGYSQVERPTLGLTHDQFVTGRAILGVVGLVALCWIAFRVWRARRHTS